MATMQKQPMKMFEVPLAKFYEDIVPHHQEVFESFRTRIAKNLTIGNKKGLKDEIQVKQKSVRKLKDLMYELDTLRTQVEDVDLDLFDTKTLSLRKTLLNLISSYSDLEKKALAITSQEEENEASIQQFQQHQQQTHLFSNVSTLQVLEDMEELKLRQREELHREVETINQNASDLQEIYTQLHSMVNQQGADVEQIHESVDSTQKNVDSGYRSLVKAYKLKSSLYPVTGALLGSLVGGPVGFLAGLKMGGIAALGCAFAGYTGGRIFKKNTDKMETSNGVENECPTFNEEIKKDN